PAGALPRRRPLVSHADLIRAVAELAPDDPKRAREIAVLLGLLSAPARAARPPERTAPPPEPPGVTPASPSAADYAMAEHRAAAGIVPSWLVPLMGDGQATDDEGWLLAVGPLDPRRPGRAHEALAVEP